MVDEGALDPWVSEWMEANPERGKPLEDLVPEILELARGDYDLGVTRQIARVEDGSVDGVPIRIYRHDARPTGVVVYFHGGGFVMGSISIMDNVAREIAYASRAQVVSVGYRLAPENPYPAGLDDCERVTRWAWTHRAQLGAADAPVAVAGESAGGNLAAAVALRLRDAGETFISAQVLIYPAMAGTEVFPSRREFDGLVISLAAGEQYWAAYSGGRDLDRDPYAVPLAAPSLKGLPPAIVILGGCDMLRDEGRAFAGRLRDDGVEVEEVCYPSQPHGFVNFGFPAANEAFDRIGTWLRAKLTETTTAR